MKQRTAEWYKARVGKITASQFDVVCKPGNIKAMAKGQLSAGAMTYMCELVGETLTGEPAATVSVPATEWGIQYEHEALQAHMFESGDAARECGFFAHPTERLVGGSPDALIDDDGLVEIKCPITPKGHAAALIAGKMPDQHIAQVQGNLWITHRKWCDFVSYHPRFPRSSQLYCQRIARDDDYIDTLANAILDFRDKLVEVLKNYE